MTSDRHYFHIKGQNAEELLNELAHSSFLVDWCFPNPKGPDGKEICDLLVVFDNTAIIWQVKDLKLNKDEQIKDKDFNKNLRQVFGAHKSLFSGNKKIILENSRRRPHDFDPADIDEVFLISCFMGSDPAMLHLIEQNDKNKMFVHIFNKTFTEIVLSELDTIQDFISYLRVKEKLLLSKSSITINGGEQELLAYYLTNMKSFENLHDATDLMVDEGGWQSFFNSDAYKKRRRQTT